MTGPPTQPRAPEVREAGPAGAKEGVGRTRWTGSARLSPTQQHSLQLVPERSPPAGGLPGGGRTGPPSQKDAKGQRESPQSCFQPRGQRPSAGQPAPLRGRPLPRAWQGDDPDLPPDRWAMPPVQWPNTGCPGERLGRGSSRPPGLLESPGGKHRHRKGGGTRGTGPQSHWGASGK